MSDLRRLGAGRNRWLTLALVPLAIIVATLTAFAIKTPSSPPPTQAGSQTQIPTATATNPPLLVSFIGDSFTAGTTLGGIGDAGYPALLSEKRGWVSDIEAVGGTGFVAGKKTNDEFGARVTEVVAKRPAMVLIVGGGNDSTQDPAAVRSAAESMIRDLQTKLPTSKIVLIAPLWLQQVNPPSLGPLHTEFRQVAKDTKVTYIDPTGWWDGHGDLLGADKVHPTDAGHRLLAQMIDRALTQHGVR